MQKTKRKKRLPKLHFDKHRRVRQYYVTVTRSGRTHKVYFGRDKELAEKEYSDFLADYMAGKADEQLGLGDSLVKLAEQYLDFVLHNKSKATYDQYRTLISAFVKQYKDRRADDLAPGDLEAEKVRLQKRGNKPSTINHFIKCVKAMYNWGVRYGQVRKNPFAQVSKLPQGPRKIRFLSEAEITKLLGACDGIVRDMVTIYLDTGMRLSELAGLTKENLDFRRGTITVWDHKTSRTAREPKPRVIPMTTRVRDILKQHVCDDGPLFRNDAGNAYDKDTLRRRFDREKAKVGLNDVTIHTLRHTFGSRAVMAGVDLRTVAELMGHSTQRTTELYAHLSAGHLKQAIEKIENHTSS